MALPTRRLDEMLARVGVPISEASVVFERRLERTYWLAVRARATVERMADVVAAATARLAELATDPALDDAPMTTLARKLRLRDEQLELVWAIVTCSIDGRLVSHLEALGGAHARRGLSLHVYAMLAGLDDDTTARLAHWLAAPNPLVDDGLVEVTEPASPAARAYVASSRLVGFLAGEPVSIAPLVIVEPQGPLLHDDRQLAAIDEIATALGHGRDAVVVIEGPAGSGRATAAATATGASLVVLDLARVSPTMLAAAIRELRRECMLRDAIPLVANADVVGDDARRLVGDLLDQARGPVIVTSSLAGADLGTSRAIVRIAWSVPDTAVRVALWTEALESIGATSSGDLAGLAHRYRIGPAAIHRAVTSVELMHTSDAPLSVVELAAGLRHNIAERLGGLASRVEVNQTWDDLVVADDIADLILTLVGRIRHAHQVLDRWGYRSKIARGTGVAALFSGPPGTGKTMVAGLIAKELDLELYQVDLSKVVSKWIGETEQNLARVFDAAEEGHALLLFDEADALFGQRSTEMRGATDRYANLEVNYLLQRVEAFGGITVLTTNMDTAIDTALKRRLSAHVVFATPDEGERTRLWERQTNTGLAPIAHDVDHAELSQAYPAMTGANIRNAAIAAAFLAAADDSPSITRDHLLRAARSEYRSMGHMVSDAVASVSRRPRSR